jgi:hypothetical protein
VVGELADDAAQTPGVEELLVVVAQVEHDLGTALGALDVLDRVGALAGRLPAHALVGAHAGASGRQRDLVGHDEGRVETDPELPDQLAVVGLVTGQVLDESAGPGTGDGADGLVDLLAAHADAIVGHRQGPGLACRA